MSRLYDSDPALPQRPLPEVDEDTAPLWEGCAAGELRIQCCDACGSWRYYPAMLCANCQSDAFTWKVASGEGSLYAFTVVREAPVAAFAARVPYVYALVELAEGPIMATNIVGADPGTLAIGAAVRLVFERVTPELALPVFELVSQATSA